MPSGNTCGDGTQTRTYTCQNPPCCSASPASDSQGCSQPCNQCVYILGYERFPSQNNSNIGTAASRTDIPQCLKDEFINNKRCQYVQDHDSMDYCDWNMATVTCDWATQTGSTFIGYWGGGHGKQGVYWADSCYINSNVFNDPNAKHCAAQCRKNTGFNCVTAWYGNVCGWGVYLTPSGNVGANMAAFQANLGPSDACIRDVCGMRRYDLGAVYAFLGLQVPPTLPSRCTDGMIDYTDFQSAPQVYNECRAEFFLDANCKQVPAGPNVCGVVDLQATPISLVWEEQTLTPTVARFSLDPTIDAPWSVWKGSSSMPLLVYDPQHTGSVTSAMQLFGRYALGGKEAELIKTSGSVNGLKPGSGWKHGYEALGLLDSDRSGVLDGIELDSLALWFDKNQDAVSQAGEVIAARDAGLTSLYYRDVETKGSELGISLGYERNKEGTKVSGRSIDWLGAVYRDKADAMMALLVGQNGDSLAGPVGSETDLGNEAGPLSPILKGAKQVADLEKLQNMPDVSGFWQWAIVEEGGRSSNNGYFVLNDNGLIVDGWSVMSAKVGNTKTGMRGENVFTLRLLGQKGFDSAGGQEIALEIRQQESITRSTASVSPSGKAMYGQSVQQPIGDSSKAKLEYKWYARKITARQK